MVIFTIAGVSASEVNEAVIAIDANDDVIAIDDAPNEDISASEDENAIADTPKTMTELKDIIDSTQDTIILNDDYSYVESDELENGIEIRESLTIDGKGHTIDAAGKMRIFQVTNNAVVTFKNIIFENGWTGSKGYGGAVWNNGGNTITVINCTFNKNSANYGGAISRVNAINCTFINNEAYEYGGAMYEGGSAVNCTFVNNKAKEYGGAMEGGSAVNCSAVNCTFINNTAIESGAVEQLSSAVNCIFINNTAEYTGAMYGGHAINCTFINNKGGVSDTIGDGLATNCTFVNNSVGYSAIEFYITNPVLKLVRLYCSMVCLNAILQLMLLKMMVHQKHLTVLIKDGQ